MKVLFLDIDGVLQPCGRQERFEHKDEILAISAELNKKIMTDFDYESYIAESYANLCDIGAVYFDWDKSSVERLRHILDATGARVVLSSDWREGGMKRMKGLMAIHGLDGYLDDATFCILNKEQFCSPENRQFYIEKQNAWNKIRNVIYEFLSKSYSTDPKIWSGSVDYRAAEIREYLDRHPEITSFVVLDDRNLEKGLDGHFIHTKNHISEEDMWHSIEILNRENGPCPLDAVLHTPELEECRKMYTMDNSFQKS